MKDHVTKLVHKLHSAPPPISHDAAFRARSVQISVLNDALWDMGQLHCGICEMGLLEFQVG